MHNNLKCLQAAKHHRHSRINYIFTKSDAGIIYTPRVSFTLITVFPPQIYETVNIVFCDN